MEEIAERLKTEFPAEPVTDPMAALLARLTSAEGTGLAGSAFWSRQL